MFLNSYFCSAHKAFTALILACACFAATVQADPLPVVRDLEAVAKIARVQHAPVFVAFTLKRCPYCNTARRDYWVPMNSDNAWRGKVVMVELVMDATPELHDFEGKPTNARDFARRFGIRSAPTVIVFDADGTPATQPLVGLSSGDFYGAYLERAIEAGVAKMRSMR